MAQGDAKQFYDYPLKAGNQELDNSSDVFKARFTATAYASVDITASNPNVSTYAATTGGNFSGDVTLTSVTFTRSGAISTFDAAALSTISKNASNPTDIRSLIVYNDTHATDFPYQVFDLTTDGTTAIDVVNNDFDFDFGASGVMTGTANT